MITKELKDMFHDLLGPHKKQVLVPTASITSSDASLVHLLLTTTIEA
jgi:hypothetical protein